MIGLEKEESVYCTLIDDRRLVIRHSGILFDDVMKVPTGCRSCLAEADGDSRMLKMEEGRKKKKLLKRERVPFVLG